MIFLFVSCSMTKVFYNYADFFVVNWFESYLKLNETQRSDLNIKVDKFFAWHRKSELPKTVLFLEELKVRYENGMDKQDINWIRSESKILLVRVLRYAEEDIVAFLLTIDDYQVLEAKEKLSSKEDDWLIEQSKMSFEELREHILERSYDFLDEWLGSLESDQKEIIATWVNPDPYWVSIRLRNRDRFQSDLIDLLKSKELLKTNIHSWLSDPSSHWTDEYKSVIEGKRKEWEMLTLMLDANTTPRQREHAIDKLSQYIDDFKELANVD